MRLVFVTGEGFGEEARSDLIDRLKRLARPDPRVSVSYGATEMQGGMVECTHGSGYHNPAPDQFLFEAVDPQTHEAVPDGDEGLILLTHLDRRGTVMLRYALGDVARLTRGALPALRGADRAPRQPAASGRQSHQDQGHAGESSGAGGRRARRAGAARFPGRGRQGEPERSAIDGPAAAAHRAGGRRGLPQLEAALAARVQRAIGVTPLVEGTTADDPLLVGRGWKAKPILDLRK